MSVISIQPEQSQQNKKSVHNSMDWLYIVVGLLPDTQICGLRMRRECRESFPRHRLQRKPVVSDPNIHHDTCVTHVSGCMSGSLTSSDGENVFGIPGACATRNFPYLARGPWCYNTVITLQISLPSIELATKCEISSVFCEFNMWFIFFLCNPVAVCDIALGLTRFNCYWSVVD